MSKRKSRRKTTAHEDQATPQTRKRLSEGTLARLISDGSLSSTGPEMIAVEEISKCYMAATAEMGWATGSMERVSKSGSTYESEYMVQLRQDKYLPWRKKVGEAAANSTTDIAVWGFTARELDRRYRRRNGTTKDMLIWALRQYAVIAQIVPRGLAEKWGKQAA